VLTPAPPRSDRADLSLLVFAQARDARVDIDGWNAHAMRFFATRLGLTEERRYPARGDGGPMAPLVDTVGFVIAPDGLTPGVRGASARPHEAADLALAEATEARRGFTGLAALARRTGMVWRVEREAERDPLALRLAAILASVLLGPILDPLAGELFGVKTARAKLEAIKDAP
jgi:hypothetical protein